VVRRQQDDLVEAFANGEDVYKDHGIGYLRKDREEVTAAGTVCR
jgi:DNA polymerase I-like protein with 3'-5' exonuclease and polymerase domains